MTEKAQEGLVVRVHKADDYSSDEDTTSGVLHVELPLGGVARSQDAYERRRGLFDEDAAAVVDFLSSTLPGGVYDRVLGLLLAGKANDLIISHREIKAMQDGPELPTDGQEHAVFLSQLRLSLGLADGSKPTTIEEEATLIEEVDRLVGSEKKLLTKLRIALCLAGEAPKASTPEEETYLLAEVDELMSDKRTHDALVARLRLKLGVCCGEDDALLEKVDRLVQFERKHAW